MHGTLYVIHAYFPIINVSIHVRGVRMHALTHVQNRNKAFALRNN